MKEKLISLETAKLAKEKGFDIRQELRWIEVLSIESGFVIKKPNPKGNHLPWVVDEDNTFKSVGVSHCGDIAK